MMKRRNADNAAKLRQRIKKSRIGEGVMNWAPMIYVKLLLAWAALMGLDYIFGFRLEYLWPTWLLVRSIYDSFRYQGLAFSVFFVCVTVTSDLLFFLCIPTQLLFLIASTYVWLQYVWHADRGVCLPTVCLCLLFVYVEASVRLRELAQSRGGLPFTLDLCRPFAAHCIGYPVVTLGFGIKSYVGYKYRLRRQREIAKENEIYNRILMESLPADYQSVRAAQHSIANGDTPHADNLTTYNEDRGAISTLNGDLSAKVWASGTAPSMFVSALRAGLRFFTTQSNQPESDSEDDDDADSSRGSTHASAQGGDKLQSTGVQPKKTTARKARKAARNQSATTAAKETANGVTPTIDGNMYHQVDKGDATRDESECCASNVDSTEHTAKCKRAINLENEVDSLKKELRAARLNEQDARLQVKHLTNAERAASQEATHWKGKYDAIDTKLQNERRAREQDKTNIQILEKKLCDEQQRRLNAEQALEKERKAQQKQREHETRMATRAQEKNDAEKQRTGECGEMCQRRRERVDAELRQLKSELKQRDGQIQQRDAELHQLRQYRDAHNSEVLMTALSTMKEKNAQLEKSLSAENRLKQDLFSALGEAKHQIDRYKIDLQRKDEELEKIKRGMPVSTEQAAAITPPPPAPVSNPAPPTTSLASAFGGGLQQYHHLNNGHTLNFDHFGTSMASNSANNNDDLSELTNAIYSGVAAYLNTSTTNGPAQASLLDGDRFEDALSTQANGGASSGYTPPRSH